MTPTLLRCATLITLLSLTLSGCALNQAKTQQDKRQVILSMKDEVLTELFKAKPDVRAQLSSAPGYAVFSNANFNLLLASFGGGYGMVKDNRSKQVTYMNMGEVGLGLGLGVKDFRMVMVFHSDEAMQRFIEQGWALGAQADAAVKARDKGAAVGGEATIDNITLYQLTESGIALQATVKGTKFWPNQELN
jgi:lipid-binding SYLF domain-containing protein